jgi:hypothetical protein
MAGIASSLQNGLDLFKVRGVITVTVYSESQSNQCDNQERCSSQLCSAIKYKNRLTLILTAAKTDVFDAKLFHGIGCLLLAAHQRKTA